MKTIIRILILAGAVPALIYAGMTIGYRVGAVDLGTIFGALLTPARQPGWLIWGMGGGAVVALLAGIISIFSRMGLSALLALLIAGASAGMTVGPLMMFAKAREVPPIHDITTDWESPPQFVETATLRTAGQNPAAYDREQLAQQREAYPDIETIRVNADVAEAFDACLDAVRRSGLAIVAADRAAGRIEATATSKWFGFRDDVAFRIVAGDGETLIDIRSKSRVGRSDIGANADRIRALEARIREGLTG